MREVLQVGIVLDPESVPAWQMEMIDRLARSGVAALYLVAVGPRKDARLMNGCLSLLRSVIEKAARSAARLPREACARMPATGLSATAPRLETRTHSDDESALEDRIRAEDLDVILVAADGQDVDRWRSLARFGAWYFRYRGLPFTPADGSLVGATEVLRRESSVSISLCISHAAGSERIAYETHSAVDHASFARTRDEHLWKCSLIPARALRACFEGRHEWIQRLPDASRDVGATSRVTAVGSAALKALPLVPGYLAWRVRRKLARRSAPPRWILMCCRGDWLAGLDDFMPVPPPPGRFWADPQVIVDGGRTFVFFEDADLQTGKGRISVGEVAGDGLLSNVRTALARPYHLSYPFVFKWRGDHYMVPESAENRSIEVYRCRGFPDDWTYSHELMSGVLAYDATLVEFQGLWWMFANLRESDDTSSWDELHLFWADNPLSTSWSPHPANPVVSDVRRARPAGPLFMRDGCLYRPSQDSSGRYGRALVLNRVLEMNATVYRETAAARLDPDTVDQVSGIHTYSSSGMLTFVDALHSGRAHPIGEPER